MPRFPKPPGHHTIVPGFAVVGAEKVLTFIQKAFGGEVVERYEGPGGSIMHCEVRIGDSVIMFGEANPAFGMDAMPASLAVYVDEGPDVDATYERALKCGGEAVMAPADQFYGYRSATLKDMGGNKWTLCAVVEQVAPQEIQRRMAEMMKGCGG